MGCCCSADEEPSLEGEGNPGPDIERRCTDVLCIPIFAFFLALPLVTIASLKDVTSASSLTHGHDHYRNFCGKGTLKSKPFVYFPDLETDIERDPTLTNRYGVCVEQCPKQFALVDDYEAETGEHGLPLRHPGEPWYVPLPTFRVVGRCIPFDPPPAYSNEVEMCASPRCKGRGPGHVPTSPQEVCGLQSDHTENFWLLTEADDILIHGWRREGVTNDRVIQARLALSKSVASEEKKACQVKVLRDTRVQTEAAHEKITYKILTKYTGKLFLWCSAVYENQAVVIGFGVGGSLALSFLLIAMFSHCVECVISVLVLMLFVVLICTDYVFFFQAGIATGKTGRFIIDTIESTTHLDVPHSVESLVNQAAETETGKEFFKWCGIALAVAITLLACGAMAARKNFKTLVALLKEASQTLREMPSLLVAPLALAASMVVTSLVLLWVMLSIATLQAWEVPQLLELWQKTMGAALQALGLARQDALLQMKEFGVWLIVFNFLWAYYFHVALSIAITAMCVSQWYFYRNDPERNAGTGINSEGWFFGRPVIHAVCRIFRYHLGSLVYGACIMAVATTLRWIFEYIAKQAEDGGNPVTRAIVWSTRCCLWCLEKCLQFITEYAYVYVAVTGKPFCSAARASFVFIAKYPVQTAMDKMVSTALGYLLCVTVPVGLAVASFVVVGSDWPACAVFIVCLAYVVTRLAAGIYDVCVTTLFVCLMRDCEHYGGRYMSKNLGRVCGFDAARDDADAGSSIELQETAES